MLYEISYIMTPAAADDDGFIRFFTQMSRGVCEMEAICMFFRTKIIGFLADRTILYHFSHKLRLRPVR